MLERGLTVIKIYGSHSRFCHPQKYPEYFHFVSLYMPLNFVESCIQNSDCTHQSTHSKMATVAIKFFSSRCLQMQSPNNMIWWIKSNHGFLVYCCLANNKSRRVWLLSSNYHGTGTEIALNELNNVCQVQSAMQYQTISSAPLHLPLRPNNFSWRLLLLAVAVWSPSFLLCLWVTCIYAKSYLTMTWLLNSE